MAQKAKPTKPEELFIDEAHDAFKDCILKSVDTQFGGNQNDIDAQFQLYQIIVRDRLTNFTVKAAFESAYELAQNIQQRVSGISECHIKFAKGKDGKDTADMHLTLTRAPCYFYSNQFGYYQSPNQIHYGYTVRDYKTTLGGLLKPFQSTTGGYKWNYGKNQSLYYLQQEMKPFSVFGNRVRTIYQETSSGRGIETNVGEAVRKTSLLFEVDLFPEKRPDIFRHSFITDPNNYLYLKLIQKTRKNKVDTDHCSKLLMERALCGDQLYSAKLGLKLGQVYDSVYLENSYLLLASSEIASNFTDSRFLRHKFFTRYTQSYGNAQFKFSLAGGLVQNLTAQPLRVNDNFYLWNYKGIRNIGYHYDEQKDKQGGGLHGENLGFDRYLAFEAKLHQLESPLLSVFNIEPFIHLNAALAPNRNKPDEGDSFLKRYGRASIGFGASLQLLGAAIECYYSPFVYRQKNEIKAEFQINIGID